MFTIAHTNRTAVFGPGATLWFRFLANKVVIPGRPNAEILARVGLDQCVFASTNLFLFLSSMALMEGSDPQEKLKSSYDRLQPSLERLAAAPVR